jgi:hypothetical protein
MVFPIVGGDGKPTGYEIENSLRFNDDDGAYLQRTAGANTGEDNATLSFWFKLGSIKGDNNGGTIMTEGGTSGYHIIQIYAHKIYIGSSAFNIMFPNLIRDPSAWYHLFIAFDSSQGTNTNRVKAYLNGVLLTGATGFTDYPAQNENLALCVNGNTTRVGSRGNTGASAFDGYLAEFHFLDGTTKAHTDFGETNDNGVWIPKKYIGGSYGDNGFFLEFKQTGTSADASGIGADTSGEGHHFSVSTVVATDVTTDTPTNNFCTLNPLDNYFQAATFAEGNTKITTNASNYSASSSTIGVANGKWYFEAKATDVHDSLIGASGQTETSSTNGLGQNANQVGYLSSGNARKGGSDTSTGYDSYTDGDIIGVALDIDNSKIYFSKNGTYQASGDPANNSNGFALTAVASTSTGFYTPSVGDNGSSAAIWEMNFGNAPFSISSGNSDGAGHGNFEYAVPSGYFALCTKNLANHG